jgi:hypothetical protein
VLEIVPTGEPEVELDAAQITCASGFPALVIPAMKVMSPPAATVATFGEIVTAISLRITIDDVALDAESADKLAVIAAVAGTGRMEGAVYKPELEMIPTLVLPPRIPFTLHWIEFS